MNGPSGERVTEWAGGSLSELMSVLSAAALPACIRVFAPGAGGAQAGEVHLLAGGLNDAFAGDRRGQEAVAALQQLAGARFVIDTRLPDPKTGSLAKPGPGEGNLAQRPLVEVMRYCEEYVLTCTLEVWRGEEQASISYRRGELVGTVVGGSEAPERLPEVMAWKEGFFEIDLPLPVTPPAPAPSRRNTASAAVVGDGAPAQPPSGVRQRRGTDPLISLAAINKSAPARPAGAPVRPTGESGPKLPRVPSLPGFKSRVAAPMGSLPTRAAGSRPAPSAPAPVAAPIRAAPPSAPAPAPPAAPIRAATPSAPAPAPVAASIRAATPSAPAPAPAAAPIRAATPSAPAPAPAAAPIRAATPAPVPRASTTAPARAERTPVVAQAAPTVPAARPVSTAGIPAEKAGATVSPARAPDAGVPTALAVAAGLPVTSAPGTAPSPQAPLPPPLKPIARAPAADSPLAPVPWPATKPSVAQSSVRPMSSPVPEAAATPPSTSQGSAATPPPASAPASRPAETPAAPVKRTTRSPATPPPATAVSVVASGAESPPRPSEPAAAPSPAASRGASPAESPELNHISGEIVRPSTPTRGIEQRPFGVEISDDMQDPAAYVDTPPPEAQVMVASATQTTPTPVSALPRPAGPSTDRSVLSASVQPDDLAVDPENPRFRPGKRRAQRGLGDWPLLVHVLLGIVLGAAIVVAYSAYYGLPLPLP